MKPVAWIALLLLGSVLARAELFRPETVRGALLGGVAGAVIGHNDGRHGWEGAAYGAAAGAIVGSIVGEAREQAQRPPVPRSSYDRWDRRPRWSISYGYGHGYDRYRGHGFHRHGDPFVSPWGWRHAGWGYHHVSPYRRVVYSSRYDEPSWAARGALWGGLAGAVIGHNHGRRGWEGAGYGVAGGYLVGSLMEQRARRLAEERARGTWSTPAPVAPAAAPAAPVTIINNIYTSAPATPMGAANRAFGR